jgi:hypothetical protein
LRGVFDIEKALTRIKEIENLEAQDSFWSEPKDAQKIIQEKKILSENVKNYQILKKELDDLNEMA